MSTPFSYHLYHQPTSKHYYGIKHSKNCHPSQLWVSYFSSSKVVKQLIEQYGADSFVVEVRREFNTSQEALLWEHKVLRRLNAAERVDWINRHNGGTKFRAPTAHTQEVKDRIRIKMQQRVLTEEHKQRISEASLKDRQRRKAIGWKMPTDDVARRAAAQIGVPRDSDTVAKMRATKTGKKKLILSCGAFVFV